MKISFSKEQKYVPTWRGNDTLPLEEQVSVTLKVMNMASLMGLLDVFSEVGLTGEVDTEKVSNDKIKPIVAQFGSMMPEYVVDLKGLFDTAGEAMTVEDIVTYPVFLNLCLELLMKLTEISSPSDDDVGNSNEPSV
jgi:hypothetical protein